MTLKHHLPTPIVSVVDNVSCFQLLVESLHNVTILC